MAQEIFKRYEKKYLLSRQQYEIFKEAIGDKVIPDEYEKYTICNIYFDTRDYELIRTSLGKPVYKEKLRLRSYGVPEEQDTVFVEMKKKFEGVVYKRRASLTLKEAEDYLYRGIHPGKDTQILRELDYFLEHYRLYPAVFLAYDRIAYAGREDPELRVTFDTNIRCRESNLHLDSGSWGTNILPRDQMLMEVKIPGVMPMWMSRLLSELEIYPTSYSKYGTYYQKMCAGDRRTVRVGERAAVGIPQYA